jgi:hypothetical protein
MKRMSEGRKTEACAQFIPVSYSLLDNRNFRNLLMTKKRFRTYLWLRRHVVRGPKLYDPCDLFQNYWTNGELATSLKLDKIAKDLGLSKSTVGDHIRQLENDGILIVDAVSASEAPHGKAHLFFILGTCVGGQERWLIDDVFNGANKN